ncbi:ATP-binding protein [Streptomyces uncialis]|uniref:ATP-binding protein n=1 Tax=Streptomyces uncialis TaxID=1048205 RepID=UPI003656B351
MAELRGDAAQIASELATNAVLHTGARTFCFKIERRPGRVRISAEDSTPGLLPARRAPDDSALSGRGLHLVDALCARSRF